MVNVLRNRPAAVRAAAAERPSSAVEPQKHSRRPPAGVATARLDARRRGFQRFRRATPHDGNTAELRAHDSASPAPGRSSRPGQPQSPHRRCHHRSPARPKAATTSASATASAGVGRASTTGASSITRAARSRVDVHVLEHLGGAAQAEVGPGISRSSSVRGPRSVAGTMVAPIRVHGQVAATAQDVARDRTERGESHAAPSDASCAVQPRPARPRRCPSPGRCRRAVPRTCRCEAARWAAKPSRRSAGRTRRSSTEGRRPTGRRRRPRPPARRSWTTAAVAVAAICRPQHVHRAVVARRGPSAPRRPGSRPAPARCAPPERCPVLVPPPSTASTAARPAHAVSTSSSTHQLGTQLAEAVQDGLHARRRSRRPASAAPRSFRRRRRGHRPARRRPPRSALTRLPVVGIDIPEHIAVAQPAEPGEDAWIVVARAERAAKPGSRIDSGRGDDGLGRLADVGRQALVASAAASVHGCASGFPAYGRTRRSAGRSVACAVTQRPCRKNVARTPRRSRSVAMRPAPPGSARAGRVLGVDGECHPQPAHHSRVGDLRARQAYGARVVPATSAGHLPGQKLGGDDGGRRDQAGGQLAGGHCERAGRSGSRRPTPPSLRRRRRQLGREAQVDLEGRRFDCDHDRGQCRRGQLERDRGETARSASTRPANLAAFL